MGYLDYILELGIIFGKLRLTYVLAFNFFIKVYFLNTNNITNLFKIKYLHIYI